MSGEASAAGLSEEARGRLFRLARQAITAQLAREPFEVAEGDLELAEPRGVFVTLRLRPDRELRGCIGFVEPRDSLAVAVARAAAAAAVEDYRFDPVTVQELPLLELEISILGRPRTIRPEDLLVGTHGLIVRHRGHGGLLLPQVASDRGWDRETFLEQTCRKAGLQPDAWRDPACELLAFTASVLVDPDPPDPPGRPGDQGPAAA